MVSAADLSGLILPTSRLRVFWDMMTMAMVMYTAISLPVVVVYPDFEVPVALTVFEIAMDVIFILDIGLNFRTAFVEDAVLIVDKQRIMRKYARKWLAIDVVGCRTGMLKPLALVAKEAVGCSGSGSGGRPVNCST